MPELPDDLCVSINVSPAAVVQLPWAQLLTDVDPTRVVLEITEHDAVQNYSVLDAAWRNAGRGVMRYRRRCRAPVSPRSHTSWNWPRNSSRSSRSITRNIDVGKARLRLARAIGEFARRTGSRVIAEGVELQGRWTPSARPVSPWLRAITSVGRNRIRTGSACVRGTP